MAGPGIEPGTSGSGIGRASDCATRSGSVCVVCVREREGYLYSHVSGRKFYFEKIIAIFFWGQKLLHVRGKASIPFEWLSRRL